MMAQPRRKKWTEAEERTLIDKYEEMVCDGTLAKMKTREKKFKPVALHVNSMHHIRDPITYPWQWTWKDVSTKVQNMRHQYALVKQKIRKVESVGGDAVDEFDWMEGLTHWSNFLRYKEVFGDVAIVFGGDDSVMVGVTDGDGNNRGFDGSSHEMEGLAFGQMSRNGVGEFVPGIDGVGNGVMELEFEYEGEEGDDYYDDSSREKFHNRGKEDRDVRYVCGDNEPTGLDTRKKMKVSRGCEKKAWAFVSGQLRHLKEMESRFEQSDAEREQERQQRENAWRGIEQERERHREEWEKERNKREKARESSRMQRLQEWEEMEKQCEERDRRRREEGLVFEREWEERMNRRRSEWKKRMDEMLTQHRAEMSQMQTRILHEQQNLTNQLLGIVSQWTGHPTGISDHTGAGSHYFSQMMQNLQHVNGMVHGDTRVDGDNQEDHFIVDG